ncbi:MAG: FAD:protein FMN transferase [Lachnospiraceae bacterium]|nr:FAD:protein FMN transferase [Lachnospiraceae bacterium]
MKEGNESEGQLQTNRMQESSSSASGAPQISGESISDTGFYFDTVVTIKLNGTSDKTILRDCFDKMAEYEALLSRTREGSDIWNVNHSGGQPVEVSDETAALIELAMKYAELSDGAFDITVAPYLTLWDFQNNSGSVPPDETIAAAREHVGLSLLHLEGNTVTLDDPEAAIDLGGIAKGYIADHLKELLAEKGIQSAWINLGGNVLAIGQKPDGTNWNIGIRNPFGEATDIIAIVKTADQSVVTSGTYERFFEKDGTIYHHILNPKNGYPVQNGLKSVTILSDSSADGDALSTTCFVLGMKRGMELVESLDGIEAMFVTDDREIQYSSGFPVSDIS